MSEPATPRDVRMRGFASRSTVETALAWIDRHAQRLDTEAISLWNAAGRVLAEDIVSAIDVPAFARSMMDGFAVQAAATLGASPYNALPLQIVGQALPGAAFVERMRAGEAVRIMTGAPLPAGADAVIPAERVEVDGQTLRLIDEVPPGKNVAHIGEDVRAAALVLTKGRVLRPQDLGLLSSLGVAAPKVIRRPVVRLIVTGNELLPAGETATGHQIADANGPMLATLVQRDGGVPQVGPSRRTGPAPQVDTAPANYLTPDNPQTLLAALREPADIIIVSGGSSVGQEDHAPRMLAEHGELAIHGIAMRPSSPTGMGLLDGRLVFLLPGNPVSCLCAYDFFAGRAIRLLGGRSAAWPHRQVDLPLARKLVSQIGRVDYARVRLIENQVEPLAISGASILSSTTAADGFVIVPADSEGYPPGANVCVFLYDNAPAAPWRTP